MSEVTVLRISATWGWILFGSMALIVIESMLVRNLSEFAWKLGFSIWADTKRVDPASYLNRGEVPPGFTKVSLGRDESLLRPIAPPERGWQPKYQAGQFLTIALLRVVDGRAELNVRMGWGTWLLGVSFWGMLAEVYWKRQPADATGFILIVAAVWTVTLVGVIIRARRVYGRLLADGTAAAVDVGPF
jgi:hypothetical protein